MRCSEPAQPPGLGKVLRPTMAGVVHAAEHWPAPGRRPCAAASPSSRLASARSCGPPSAVRSACCRAWPAPGRALGLRRARSSRLASAKSCGPPWPCVVHGCRAWPAHWACPCAAASPYSRLASAKSCGPPWPWKCMLPRLACAWACALRCGEPEQPPRLGQVLRPTLAGVVHAAEHWPAHGRALALRRARSSRLASAQVLRHTMTGVVHVAKLGLRFGVALGGSEPEPPRLLVVFTRRVHRLRVLLAVLLRSLENRAEDRGRTGWSVSRTRNHYPSPNADRTRAQPSATLSSNLPNTPCVCVCVSVCVCPYPSPHDHLHSHPKPKA